MFKAYSQRRLELSVRDGCVLWGARVVVPKKGRATLLKHARKTERLHLQLLSIPGSGQRHPGVDCMLIMPALT